MGRNFYPKLDNLKKSASFYAKNPSEFLNILTNRYQVELVDVVSVDWKEGEINTIITLSANGNTRQFIYDNDGAVEHITEVAADDNENAVEETTPDVTVADDEDKLIEDETPTHPEQEADLIEFSQPDNNNDDQSDTSDTSDCTVIDTTEQIEQPLYDEYNTAVGEIRPGEEMVTISYHHKSGKVLMKGPHLELFVRWDGARLGKLNSATAGPEAAARTPKKYAKRARKVSAKGASLIKSPVKSSPAKACSMDTEWKLNVKKSIHAVDQDICDLRDEVASIVKPLAQQNLNLKDEIDTLKQQLGAIKCMLIDIQTVTMNQITSAIEMSANKLSGEVMATTSKLAEQMSNSQSAWRNNLKVLEENARSREEAHVNSILTLSSDMHNMRAISQSATDKLMNEVQMANKLIKEQSDKIEQIEANTANSTRGGPALPPPPPPATTVTNLSSLANSDIKTWLDEPRSTYIGRRSDKRGLSSSKWQNPYIREEYGEKCLEKFEKSIRGDEELIAALPELRGKELGCFCVPHSSCHGEVLIKLLEELHGSQPAATPCKPPTRTTNQSVGLTVEPTEEGRNKDSRSASHAAEQYGGAPNHDSRRRNESATRSGPAPASRTHANNMQRDEAGFVRVGEQGNRNKRSSGADSSASNSSRQNGDAKKKIVVLIDSNRNNIDFHDLFPDAAGVEVKACSNIPSAHNTVQRAAFGCDPTDVIIHVGTNDSDVGTPQGVADSLCRLANAAARSTGARVHLSQLTPRSDDLRTNVHETNKILSSQACQWSSDVRMVTHESLKEQHLRDAKHLNRYRVGSDEFSGTQIFSAELYKSVNGNYPATSILKKSKRWFTPDHFNQVNG